MNIAKCLEKVAASNQSRRGVLVDKNLNLVNNPSGHTEDFDWSKWVENADWRAILTGAGAGILGKTVAESLMDDGARKKDKSAIRRLSEAILPLLAGGGAAYAGYKLMEDTPSGAGTTKQGAAPQSVFDYGNGVYLPGKAREDREGNYVAEEDPRMETLAILAAKHPELSLVDVARNGSESYASGAKGLNRAAYLVGVPSSALLVNDLIREPWRKYRSQLQVNDDVIRQAKRLPGKGAARVAADMVERAAQNKGVIRSNFQNNYRSFLPGRAKVTVPASLAGLGVSGGAKLLAEHLKNKADEMNSVAGEVGDFHDQVRRMGGRNRLEGLFGEGAESTERSQK